MVGTRPRAGGVVEAVRDEMLRLAGAHDGAERVSHRNRREGAILLGGGGRRASPPPGRAGWGAGDASDRDAARAGGAAEPPRAARRRSISAMCLLVHLARVGASEASSSVTDASSTSPSSIAALVLGESSAGLEEIERRPRRTARRASHAGHASLKRHGPRPRGVHATPKLVPVDALVQRRTSGRRSSRVARRRLGARRPRPR